VIFEVHIRGLGRHAFCELGQSQGRGWSPGQLRRGHAGARGGNIRLCRSQESFHARLTPKPWRCRLALPPASFPFSTSQEESKFRAWEANYTWRATCRQLIAGSRLS